MEDVIKIEFQYYKYLHGFEIENITSPLQSQFHILLFATPNDFSILLTMANSKKYSSKKLGILDNLIENSCM